MIQIRKATIEDIPKTSVLFDAYRVFYKKETNINEAKIFLSDRINNNESTIFVAEIDGELIGFVQLYPVFSSTRMKKLLLLNDLFVMPDYRGKGISVQLIDRCKKLCIDTNSCGLTLETAKSNIEGNNLYPKTGFELDNDHNFYSWDV